jgi:hypothetical protein
MILARIRRKRSYMLVVSSYGIHQGVSFMAVAKLYDLHLFLYWGLQTLAAEMTLV